MTDTICISSITISNKISGYSSYVETKAYTICICASLLSISSKSKSKYWLAHNQDNVSE